MCVGLAGPAGHAVPVSITRRFNQYPILSPPATNFSESGENRGREKKSGHAAAAPWKNFVLPYRPAPRLYRSVGREGAERSLDRPPTERRTRRSVFALGSNTCRFLPIYEDRSANGVNGDGGPGPLPRPKPKVDPPEGRLSFSVPYRAVISSPIRPNRGGESCRPKRGRLI